MQDNFADDEDGFVYRRRRRPHDSCFPPMFRLRGTVVLKIWSQGLLMTVYTTVVVVLHIYVDALRMNFPLTLVPILGVATGLVLAFRTNTAYGRYWEGRKIWSRMTVQLRFLTLCLWAGQAQPANQSNPTFPKNSEPQQENGCTKDTNDAKMADAACEELIEKVSAINLLIAFAYATKNYLRGEYSYDETDMVDLINHLPRFQTPSSNQPFESQTPYRRPSSADLDESLKEEKFEEGLSALASSGTSVVYSNEKTNVNVDSKDTVEAEKKGKVDTTNKKPLKKNIRTLKAHDYVTPTNIPIEIIYFLFTYLKHMGSKSDCDALYTLIDCLTAFERILRTPIPLAYSVHLHFCIWLYLLSLPYQLVGSLNWLTIPAVGLASFALLGILRIGFEIENPFGYDANDLPLDDFCMVIRREIQMIVGHQLPHPKSWIMSDKNRPFIPNCHLNAQELVEKPVQLLRDILAKRTTDLPVHENIAVINSGVS